MAKSKKYKDASARYDKQAMHEPAEAFGLVKSMATKKFDETVEAAFRLGVDPRKADQMLRGTVSLPAGTGKDVRVAVFAAGDAAEAARARPEPMSSAPKTSSTACRTKASWTSTSRSRPPT